MATNILKSLVRSGVRRAGYQIVRTQRSTSAPVGIPPQPIDGAAPLVESLTVATETPTPNEPAIADRELYVALYGDDVFKRRPFLNVGAGNFRHAAWRNLDFYSEAYAADVESNIDIEMDLSENLPWPIEDNSIEAAFTSHTIEHLQDHHDRHIFSEVFRVLKPGGFFRVTCPDVELYYRAYLRGDRHFFPSYAPFYVDEPIEQLFLREFATQISTANNDELPIEKVRTEEIKEVFSRLPTADALNEFTRRVDYKKWYKAVPGNHVNWWSYDKLFTFLREVGFREMYRSGYGQSSCPPMRSLPLFDYTAHTISLYAEAVKT